MITKIKNFITDKFLKFWKWIFVGSVGVAMAASLTAPARIPSEEILKTGKANIIGYRELKLNEITYVYKTDRVEVLPDEIVEKRTGNTRYFKPKKPNQVVMEVSIGSPYYKEGSEWFYLNQATTTKESFNKQMGFWNRLVKTAFADTIDEQISASADDAYELESTGTNNSTSSYIYMNSSTVAAGRYWGGMRWVASIPQNSTIDTAWIRGIAYVASYNDPNLNIHFEKTAAPAQFTGWEYDITSRTRTTASASWVEMDVPQVWATSTSLVEPLQELVDAVSPTAIVVITRPNTDVARSFLFRAWDLGGGSTANAPNLHIEYTTGGIVVGDSGTMKVQGRLNVEGRLNSE